MHTLSFVVKVTCFLTLVWGITQSGPDRGQKWIMVFGIMETEILLLEYVPACQIND